MLATQSWVKSLLAKFIKIKKLFCSVDDSIDEIKFGIDENGNYGYYKAGADSVTPFRKNVPVLSQMSWKTATGTNTSVFSVGHNLCTDYTDYIVKNDGATLTVVKPGKYWIAIAGYQAGAGGASSYYYISVNGTEKMRITVAKASGSIATNTVVLDLKAGDKITGVQSGPGTNPKMITTVIVYNRE